MILIRLIIEIVLLPVALTLIILTALVKAYKYVMKTISKQIHYE
jgi:uncharacterized membrane protein